MPLTLMQQRCQPTVAAGGCRSGEEQSAGWEQDVRPKSLKPTDAVLYELHVRDFSIHTDSGMKYRGKYKAFTEGGLRDSEGNTIGLDHLEELGVTHVHLRRYLIFERSMSWTAIKPAP